MFGYFEYFWKTQYLFDYLWDPIVELGAEGTGRLPAHRRRRRFLHVARGGRRGRVEAGGGGLVVVVIGGLLARGGVGIEVY